LRKSGLLSFYDNNPLGLARILPRTAFPKIKIAPSQWCLVNGAYYNRLSPFARPYQQPFSPKLRMKIQAKEFTTRVPDETTNVYISFNFNYILKISHVFSLRLIKTLAPLSNKKGSGVFIYNPIQVQTPPRQ
jgi:hypothetical protein